MRRRAFFDLDLHEKAGEEKGKRKRSSYEKQYYTLSHDESDGGACDDNYANEYSISNSMNDICRENDVIIMHIDMDCFFFSALISKMLENEREIKSLLQRRSSSL